MKNIFANLYNILLKHYGDPHWWPAKTPYEVIVGAILTQNTAWSNVERAIASFGEELSPGRVLALSTDELAELIRPAGFFNQKARYLKEVTAWLERRDPTSDTARVREELLSLKGVGRETADSILLYAFGLPSFVVDAYTARLLSRLNIDAGSNYEAVKAAFEENLPPDAEVYNRCHALIVVHSKERCRKKPICAGCPLTDMCVYDTI
ncbi:endonuclease [Clostridia bacterium]|nr:endonuclease [Clostridia bacterium]